MAPPKAYIEVEMLAAGHGDALLVRYGNNGKVGRILIDGGPARTYENVLARLLALPRDERHFELLVVTHIDSDHIDGIVRLLQEDLKGLGITFDDVWFNGAAQIDQVLNAVDALGAAQGEYLQALIEELGLPWNAAFGGKPVLARPTKPVTLAAGGSVRIFSPSRARLIALLTDWQKIIEAEGYATGTRADVLERLRNDRRLRALGAEPDALGDDAAPGADQTPDRTLANGSSIAFTLEVGRKRVLFTGDAHTDALMEGLDAYLAPGKRLALNAVKMPHHGSNGNWSAELLGRIDCQHFLLSSDGKYYGHPGNLTIETLISGVDRPHLWFNYATAQTTQWLDPDLAEGAIVHFPSAITYR